jgi:hypothetical protein
VRRLLACLVVATIALSCRTAGMRRAYMALDSEGLRQRTSFFTDTQSIYCIGELVSARDDVTVSAVIKSTALVDATGQLVPVQQIYTVAEQAPGHTQLSLTSFAMLQTPAGTSTSMAPLDGVPYPAGQFVCELSIDGQLEESLSFSIDYPDCPTVPVAATISCQGWVKQGSRCPSSTPGQTCTCGTSGLWECP